LLGIPLAVTWGLLSFITNYIPNIGFILGVIPPALLGLLTGGPKLMVIVIVVYCVLNTVIQSVIQPRFIGDAVGLSVTVTFVVLFFWAWLLGPLGAILAIPITLLCKALLVDIDPQARWADALLRASAKEPDPARTDRGVVPHAGPPVAGSAHDRPSIRGSREATVYCPCTWRACRRPTRSASAASRCGAGSASVAWAGCISG